MFVDDSKKSWWIIDPTQDERLMLGIEEYSPNFFCRVLDYAIGLLCIIAVPSIAGAIYSILIGITEVVPYIMSNQGGEIDFTFIFLLMGSMGAGALSVAGIYVATLLQDRCQPLYSPDEFNARFKSTKLVSTRGNRVDERWKRLLSTGIKPEKLAGYPDEVDSFLSHVDVIDGLDALASAERDGLDPELRERLDARIDQLAAATASHVLLLDHMVKQEKSREREIISEGANTRARLIIGDNTSTSAAE